MDTNLLKGMMGYVDKAFTGAKPLVGAALGFASYVMFPDRAYLLAFAAVIAAAFMDIITKYYCIISRCGGTREAIRNKKLFSKVLWKGTERKIVAYTTVAILTGLSYRVIYLKEAGILLGTFVYSVMFMREFQSNIENLIEAGADLQWLLLFSKRKNQQLMKQYEENEPPEEVEDDHEQYV